MQQFLKKHFGHKLWKVRGEVMGAGGGEFPFNAYLSVVMLHSRCRLMVIN